MELFPSLVEVIPYLPLLTQFLLPTLMLRLSQNHMIVLIVSPPEPISSILALTSQNHNIHPGRNGIHKPNFSCQI